MFVMIVNPAMDKHRDLDSWAAFDMEVSKKALVLHSFINLCCLDIAACNYGRGWVGLNILNAIQLR